MSGKAKPRRASVKSKLLKCVLLGDGGVGKSCLMNRFVNNKFDSQSFHTIGVEFLNKDVHVENQTYTLQIWDTAGQERFKSLRTPFYRGSDCCVLTFAINDRQSFKDIDMWKKEFLYYADVREDNYFPFVLLGNKMDIGERSIPTEEILSWCENNGKIPYFETSAKDATNVEEAFTAAVKRIVDFDNNTCRITNSPDTIDLKKKTQRISCC